MTKIQNYKIKCVCENLVDIDLYHSVNITVSPELFIKIKNRKINNYECKKCGRRSELTYQFLFVDIDRNIWIWCYPESLRRKEAEIKKEKELEWSEVNNSLRGLGPPKTPSLVFGYDELFDLIK